MAAARSKACARSEPLAATPASFQGLRPASARATLAARGSSKKTDTRCELTLRRALWTAGCRYRKNVAELPGRPDIVFARARVAIFCDGDFWHGRNWASRRQKLARGTNSQYWLAKIERNIERDRRNSRHLQQMGWTVLRFWGSQIAADLAKVTQTVLETLSEKGFPPGLDTRRAGGVKRA